MSDCIFYARLMTETNTFSSIATAYEDFEANGILRKGDVLYDAQGAPRAGLGPLFDFAKSRGWALRAGLAAEAAPGAPTPHRDYERLRSEILEALRERHPVRAVFLALHGAMVSTECWDCEGDLLQHVRAEVGPDVPIGVVLDPHAHLTEAMLESASILVFMKHYPHVDGLARSEEVLRIMGAMLDEGVRPAAAIADCRLIGFFPTVASPMREFVDRLVEREREEGVLSVSFVHGFPWGDVPTVGAKALVYTNGDQARAAVIAANIRDDFWRIKGGIVTPMISVDEAIALAQRPRTAPLVLADISDNPGGGAPSDSTFILRAVLEAHLSDIAIGLVYDPELVRACHQVGTGARFSASIGGKMSRYSGQPIEADVEVRALARDAMMDVMGAANFPMGDTAWIRVDGTDVILSSLRVQMYAPSGFTHLGLDPMSRKVLVVKSSNHFRATFGAIASEIAAVATPGAIDFDFAQLPYKVFKGPYFPRDADPFADERAIS